MKLVFGLIGALLVLAFLSPIIIKVKEIAMVVVIAIGLVMMLVDLWQARKEPDS